MKTTSWFLLSAMVVGACGGNNPPPPLDYTDPGDGKLRLIRDSSSKDKAVVLDLVVGSQPLTGYSVGFDLPVDDSKVIFTGFTAGDALSAGTAPIAATGQMPSSGPLAHEIVTAQSQKASGTGAVATDTTLQPGAVLYSFELDLVMGAAKGPVFDGTVAGFALPSGGMRDRSGTTVVAPADVAIGHLEVTQ